MMKLAYQSLRQIYGKAFSYGVDKETQKYYLHHTWKVWPVDLTQETESVKKTFAYMANHKEEEYVFYADMPLWIEPVWGWALTQKQKIVLESVPGNNWDVKNKWHFHPAPNPFDYTFKFWKKEYLNEVIYLNYFHNFGKNYYHFLIDLFGQLMLLEKQGVNLTLPILVHKKIWDTSFFQDAIKISSKFSSFNWKIIDNKIIHVKKAWFAKNVSFDSLIVPYVKSFFSVNHAENEKKLFLSRRPDRIRGLKNDREISAMLNNLGYTRIDTGEYYGLQEQIDLFHNATEVIGIHGAGLTNILWRNEKTSVFEIFPSDYIFHHYLVLAKGLMFDYHPIISSSTLNNFYLTKDELRNVETLLKKD